MTRQGISQTAPISEIQRFSLHDGPGIRTLVFLKGCLLGCEWCQNPESQEISPAIAFYKNRCKKSFECLKVCPDDAITKGNHRINYTKCTMCLKCIEVCNYQALELIGENLSAQDLLQAVLVDKHYYDSSNGGVTISGGEATLHSGFLDEFASLCQKENIDLTLETCGLFSFTKLVSTLAKFDLIYFDLKILDARLHKKATGADNKVIIENARRLCDQKFPVEFRFTLVEGFTDGKENLLNIIAFLKEVKKDVIHLQKYHNLGEAKIGIVPGAQKKLGLPAYPDDKFLAAASFFYQNQIKVLFDGEVVAFD